MKTKDITYGGIMIAMFLALGLIFRTNSRALQSYIEMIKTIIVAVFIQNMSRKNWWVFALSCILSCLIFVSVTDTLIYNIPAIICGCMIGLQKTNRNKFVRYIFYFFINSIMIVYEFIMFGLLMSINLFTLYKEEIAVFISELTNGIISKSFLILLFFLFMLLDSAFSSLVIFTVSQIVLKKINDLKHSGDEN